MKEINDSYGHFSGDDAIKTVAKALRDTIGLKADIYHIGGGEFVCISESNVPVGGNPSFCVNLKSGSKTNQGRIFY